jgi:two-component sensor histidine kinase
VSNDGRPLPEGFSIEGTSSLGIQIIRDLVRQMEGMVRPLSSDLTGFNVTIPFRETE